MLGSSEELPAAYCPIGWQHLGRSSQAIGPTRCGPLAQLVEQQTLNLRVRGSSPWRLTTFSSANRDSRSCDRRSGFPFRSGAGCAGAPSLSLFGDCAVATAGCSGMHPVRPGAVCSRSSPPAFQDFPARSEVLPGLLATPIAPLRFVRLLPLRVQARPSVSEAARCGSIGKRRPRPARLPGTRALASHSPATLLRLAPASRSSSVFVAAAPCVLALV